MTKVKHATSSLKRRKRTLKAVKGQRGSRSRLLRIAKEAERKSLIANYIGRKKKKGAFRGLWIARLSAACKAFDISYSKLIDGLNKAKIKLNRKMLSEIAIQDEKGFKKIVEAVKK